MPTHVTNGGTVSTHPGQGHGQGHSAPPPFAQIPVVGVTADSTVWTADTVCVTADGRVICIPAYVAEAASAIEAFDADVIAGGAVIDADVAEAADAFDQPDAVSSVSADAVEPASATDDLDAVTDVAADVVEATTALDDLDAIAVPAGVVLADVDEPADAGDQLDATVESVELPAVVPGGAHYPRRRRPLPVYGVGYGILPELWGEAHGVVGVAGKSAAQVLVRADAIGASGQAGNAAVVLKGLSIAGKGAVGTRGTGSGMIVKFSGSATGRHNDDEAAVIAFLLAA